MSIPGSRDCWEPRCEGKRQESIRDLGPECDQRMETGRTRQLVVTVSRRGGDCGRTRPKSFMGGREGTGAG